MHYNGDSTWTLRQEHYAKVRAVHHRVLLRIIGAQRKRPEHRMTSYNSTERTGWEGERVDQLRPERHPSVWHSGALESGGVKG